MASIISCLDRIRLQQMLTLPASSEERQALDSHLVHCESCRRLLLEFTSEAMRITASAAPVSDSKTADLSESRTQDRKSPNDAEASTQTRVKECDFLEPPREPEHLGRLAHYELIEVIGRGGMGTVFRAHDETLHRTVAVKLMSPELAASDISRQRFIREARAAAQVTNEHVVTIHAVDDKGRVPFLVMQFVEGKSLQQRLHDGPLPIEEIVRIGQEMAKGLAAAHAKGLVHRDIKPGNVLLEEPSGKVKITDFGLARAVDDASISQSGAVIGTPLYMAPEQARGEALDHRADLFSLGAVLYALCTGYSPFRATTSLAAMKRVCDDEPDPIKATNSEVPTWLEKAIRSLLEKNPADRIQSADEVVKNLTARPMPFRSGNLVEDDIRTESISMVNHVKSRVPFYVGTGGILLAAAIAIVFWFATRERNNSKPEEEHFVATNKEQPKGEVINPVVHENNPQIPDWGEIANGVPVLPNYDQLSKMWEMHPLIRNPDLFQNFFRGIGSGDVFGPFGGGNSGANAAQPGWMANSADGKFVAVPLGSNILLIGDKAERIPEMEAVESRIQCVAFSPDKRWLVGGCESKRDNLVVWDLKSGRIQWRPDGHQGEINSVAFGSASRFVTASNDGTAKVWSVGTKDASTTFKDHQDFVRCAVFFPNQLRVVSGGDDKVVRIWDALNGKAIKEMMGHTAPIRSIVFSPSGKVFVTGSDAEMRLWNAETFKEYTTIQTPSGWLAFSPDGLTLFSARCDHSQGTPHAITGWNTNTWEKRTSYALKSRGGQAVYHLSADGGIVLGSRPAVLGNGSPIAAYKALNGDLLSK